MHYAHKMDRGDKAALLRSLVLMPAFDNWDARCVSRRWREEIARVRERNRVEMKKLSHGTVHTPTRTPSDAFCARKVCGGAVDFQSDPLRHASNSKKSLTSPQSVARACTGLFFCMYTRKLFSVRVFGAAQVNSSLLSSCGRLTCELISNKIAWGVACDL